MGLAGNRHLAVLFGAALALAACTDGKLRSATAPALASAPAAEAAPAADVEAPKVFQITDKGLWDGRPSLGGVWVATPDAKDPERVLIKNTANGKTVVGALFRRERENPGPKIQMSSDAAEALGLLAGQPGVLNIVALQREETAAPTAAPAPDAAPAALDTTAVAAAIDKADDKAGKAGAKPAAGPGPAGAVPRSAPETVVAEATGTETPAPGIKKRKWWQRGKSAAPTQTEAEITAAQTVPAAPAAITAATLPAPSAAAPAAKAAGGKPLIQLGIFSVEDNAQRAASMVTKAGSPAQVHKEQSKGKEYWSVVVGPAETPAARTALMKKVQGLGFADAYFVSR